jgi:type IV fimbrial biogenesis protein FimT
MARTRNAGFTLVELMVGLAIAALLLVLALPNYSVWIADAQIRNAAESIASGLRYAQSQAVARNATIEFVVDPTAGIGGWRVQLAAAPVPPIQTAVFAEGADRTAITTVPAAARTVTFTSLGVISATNADGSVPLTQVQVDTAMGVAGARNLNVLVGGGASGVPGQAARTGIKICDPKWPSTDPKGCPA